MKILSGGRARAILAALAVLVIGTLAFSVAHVPDGSIGVLPNHDVLPSGWYLRPPTSRPILRGPGPLTLQGEAAVTTSEGSRLSVDYRLDLSVEPEAIRRISEQPRLGSPTRRWQEALETALAEAMAGGRAALLGTGVVRRTVLQQLRSPGGPLPGSSVIDLRLGAAAASGLRGVPMAAPVIFIGLDGADWLYMKPLLEAGKLPTLQSLLRRGAHAQLRSARPLLSPLLWTSMATGVSPDRHGIVDFTVYDPATRDRAPISSRARRRPALWNVLTAYGLHGVWIGWWATWPAEPVAGLMVSDLVSYSLFALDDTQNAAGKVYPATAWPEVRHRLTPASQVPWSELRRFVRLEDRELARLRNRSAPGPGQDFEDRLEHLRQILASTHTYHAQALWAQETLQPDLLAVYYQGIDEVSHRFMHYAPPARMKIDPAQAVRFAGVVEAFYRYQDELLGELLDARHRDASTGAGGPQPFVLVVSDHGFLSGEARPPRPADEFEGGAADWHRLHGVFILSGPGVRTSDLGVVSIYDVFPTLLYLCNLPVPEDVPGRVLLEAFEGSFVSKHPAHAVAALEVAFGAEPAQPTSLTEGERAEVLSRLRALGYVGDSPSRDRDDAPAGEKPSSDRSAGLHNEFLTAHMNLGTIHAERGEWQEAASEYRSVAERFPQYEPALYKWMESEFEAGDPTVAWQAAQRLLELPERPVDWLPAIAEVAAAAGQTRAIEQALGATGDSGAWHAARGVLAAEAGRPQEALGHFRRALDVDPLRTDAVEALFKLDSSPAGREDLMDRLRRALEIAPRSIFHSNYLAGLLVAAGRCSEARPLIESALEENPDSAPAHSNLAKCLVAQGRPEEAIAVLERGLGATPDDRGLLTTLGALEASRGRLARAIELLEQARSRFPSDPAILNALGLAQLQSGRPGEARRLLELSLEADPNQPEVRSLLDQVDR